MKVDVIIPNYNGSSLLRKNLPVLLEELEKYSSSSVIIVDDCSISQEQRILEELVNSIKDKYNTPLHLFVKNKNEGFSSTVNYGVSKSKADVVVLLNSDAAPEKGFLEPVIEDFKQNRNLFGVGFVDKSIEGDKTVLRGRGIGRWEKGFLVHSRGEIDQENTLWVSGGSSAIRRSFFQLLKGFDTLFNPFYWEDIDLSYRALKKGYDLKFENKSKVIHRHDEGVIKTHYSKEQVLKISYKNQFIFVWKNITTPSYILAHCVFLIYHLMTSLINGNYILIAGFFLALRSIPSILAFRFSNTKDKRSDSAILDLFVKG